MKRTLFIAILLFSSTLLLAQPATPPSPPPSSPEAPPLATQPAGLDISLIEKLTGLKGAMNPTEGVFKVSYPRDDIEVTVTDGSQPVRITPPMGLTCWVAFTSAGNHVMCMGDTVLTENQVNEVMSAALHNGLEVTALHNHFFFDNPKVYFMHIGGTGPQEQLAAAVGKVYETLKTSARRRTEMPAMQPPIDPANSKLDPARLDALLAAKGDYKNGVYKATFGKTTQMMGREMGNAMGVNTWCALVGTEEKAAVMGDFAMTESELQTVLKTLRSHNISIVAIHNHMTTESPRIVFLHYWAVGPADSLAKSLRSALDTQKP